MNHVNMNEPLPSESLTRMCDVTRYTHMCTHTHTPTPTPAHTRTHTHTHAHTPQVHHHRVLKIRHVMSSSNTATCCNTRQYTEPREHKLLQVRNRDSATHIMSMSSLRTATQCSTLQHTATHGSTRQHTATQCNALHHTAAHCNTLQHTATHCNTLQHTLQHNATHCNVRQQPLI